MRKLIDLLKIRREEWPAAFLQLLLAIGLNALVIHKYYRQFTRLSDDYWHLFISKFQISGFDPITYYVVSHWEARYNVYRHPLLSFLMYPLYVVNQWCIHCLGMNCAQFVVAVMLVLVSLYGFVFFLRTLRRVVGLRMYEAAVLSYMLYGFAYVMVASCVPDHFTLSLTALLLVLYLTGCHLLSHRPFSKLTTVCMFLLTAGISLNNGIKVFLSSLVVNGRRFFKPAYLLCAVILPALLLWLGARVEYQYLVAPAENARHLARKQAKERKEKTKVMTAAVKTSQKTATPTTATTTANKPSKTHAAATTAQPDADEVLYHKSKPGPTRVSPWCSGQFMRFTDASTNRLPCIWHNLFGEGMQLHADYLLQDEFRYRPMLIKYRHWWQYGMEVLIVSLFVVGVWHGRRSKLLWVALSWFAYDMALHLGLGFGLNEVYIMSAHWMFVMPLAMALWLRSLQGRKRQLLLVLFCLITVYLWVYNGSMMVQYLLN